MIFKIGLTGGIGCGKSTVANAFAILGVPTFSADSISHELSKNNQPAYQAIVNTFGEKILAVDGEIDRAALGNIVFNDLALKAKLEAILHPLIMQAMHQRAQVSDAPYCVLDIPLLINSAERHRVDRILVVLCDEDIRRERIRLRSKWSEEKINAVMQAQVNEQSLLDAADDVLDNNGKIEALAPRVAALHQRYLNLAATRSSKG